MIICEKCHAKRNKDLILNIAMFANAAPNTYHVCADCWMELSSDISMWTPDLDERRRHREASEQKLKCEREKRRAAKDKKKEKPNANNPKTT